MRGHVAPGARLLERDLTIQLEVSRTPIREALRKLEDEGLVVSFPHRGFFVRDPSFDEARQAYEMRRIVDSACCALAAERATEIDLATMRQAIRQCEEALNAGDRESVLIFNKDFHYSLAHAAHNVFLEKQWQALWTFADLLRGQWWAHTSQPETDHNEHAAIVEAIANRDVELARDLADKHIELAWKYVATRFEENSEVAIDTPPKL
ncbi:MAG: GntR family transcriptional regulator [bacterium]|nr:GntR family transcriptional regulator [bacterium]